MTERTYKKDLEVITVVCTILTFLGDFSPSPTPLPVLDFCCAMCRVDTFVCVLRHPHTQLHKYLSYHQ